MREVLGITRPKSFKEFKTFLQTMEVFGTGYLEDVDYQKYQVRQKQTHQEAVII